MTTAYPTFPEHPTGELAERLRRVRYVITDADGEHRRPAQRRARQDSR